MPRKISPRTASWSDHPLGYPMAGTSTTEAAERSAKMHVDRQRRYRSARKLSSVDVSFTTREMLNDLRRRTGKSIDGVLTSALEILRRSLDRQAKPARRPASSDKLPASPQPSPGDAAGQRPARDGSVARPGEGPHARTGSRKPRKAPVADQFTLKL